MILHEVLSWLIIVTSSLSPFYLLYRIGFRGFSRLTTYVEGNTIYHRLHPLTKLLIALVVTVICAQSVWWVGLVAGLTSLYFYYSLRRLRLILTFSSAFLIGSALNQAYYVSPAVVEKVFGDQVTVLWVFPDYFVYIGVNPVLTLQAIIYSLQVAVRVWGMLLYSGLVVLTTTPSQVVRSLHKVRVPAPVTFAVTVALVALPRVFETADTVVKLQYMKGASKWRAAFESFIPLFVYEFRKARAVSVSAETRAFMAYKTRTYIDEVELAGTDKLVALLLLALLAVDTYLVAVGLIPALPFKP